MNFQPQEHSSALLDRLARLDPPRRNLQQELDREQDGQQAEVRLAYLRLLRLMGEVGLLVAPD